MFPLAGAVPILAALLADVLTSNDGTAKRRHDAQRLWARMGGTPVEPGALRLHPSPRFGQETPTASPDDQSAVFVPSPIPHRPVGPPPETAPTPPPSPPPLSLSSPPLGIALTKDRLEIVDWHAWMTEAPAAIEEALGDGAPSPSAVLVRIFQRAFPRSTWPPPADSPRYPQWRALVEVVAEKLGMDEESAFLPEPEEETAMPRLWLVPPQKA